MIRAAVTAVVLVLGLAAPADALEPPPTIYTLDAFPTDGTVFSARGVSSCDPSIEQGGLDGGFARFACPRQSPVVDFAGPKALVELFVRRGGTQGRLGDSIVVDACGRNQCDGPAVDTVRFTPAPVGWTPVVLRDPSGVASIARLKITSDWDMIDVDDVGVSTSLNQPDTEITSGPAAQTSSHEAAFAFGANQPLATFACTLDATPVPCPAPALTAIPDGAHVLTVAARDRWGLVDPSPSTYRWTVTTPPPPDADRDGVLDARDNCSADPNVNQADRDGDGIGDACDRLPAGNVPPVAGVNAIVRDVRGDVFVKLPARAALASRPAAITLLADPGFVPLKGVASLPMGSTVDARKGSLAVVSAANNRPAGDARRRIQQARLAAGIFRIRQARARRASSRRVPTDLLLVSGAAAERTCARSTRAHPLKGIVRTLSVVGKGFFRAGGGASIATAHDATWVTTDRCDGTLTEVGRGTVAVRDRRRKRGVSVRAGRGYLVKRPLFLPLKGRPR